MVVKTLIEAHKAGVRCRELLEALEKTSNTLVEMTTQQYEHAQKLHAQTEMLLEPENMLVECDPTMSIYLGRVTHEWWCDKRSMEEATLQTDQRNNASLADYAPVGVVHNAVLIKNIMTLSERIRSVVLIAKEVQQEIEKTEARRDEMLRH